MIEMSGELRREEDSPHIPSSEDQIPFFSFLPLGLRSGRRKEKRMLRSLTSGTPFPSEEAQRKE